MKDLGVCKTDAKDRALWKVKILDKTSKPCKRGKQTKNDEDDEPYLYLVSDPILYSKLLISEIEKKLFISVFANPSHHALHQFIPPSRPVVYNMRNRAQNRHLPKKRQLLLPKFLFQTFILYSHSKLISLLYVCVCVFNLLL